MGLEFSTGFWDFNHVWKFGRSNAFVPKIRAIDVSRRILISARLPASSRGSTHEYGAHALRPRDYPSTKSAAGRPPVSALTLTADSGIFRVAVWVMPPAYP